MTEERITEAFDDISSLGVLDHEEKEAYWSSTLSGSKMISLLRDPFNLLMNYLDKNQIVFTEQQQEKMRAGTDLEEYVRQRWVERYSPNPSIIGDTIKSTFTKKFEGYEFTANIDGWLLEIKCSEEIDIEKVAKFYMPQIQYYMWFFDVDLWHLALFSNGWELQTKVIQRDNDYIGNMVDLMLQFMEAYTTKNRLFVFDNPFAKEEDPNKITLGKDDIDINLSAMIGELFEAKEMVDKYEAVIGNIKQKLFDRFENQSVKISLDYGSVSLSNSEVKGTIDYKTLVKEKLKDLPEEEIERYRKDGRTQKNMRVTSKMEKAEPLDPVDLFK